MKNLTIKKTDLIHSKRLFIIKRILKFSGILFVFLNKISFKKFDSIFISAFDFLCIKGYSLVLKK